MLVLRFKIPIDYVMDKIEWVEIGALMKFQHYLVIDAWEMARFQSYISLKSQTNYKGEITDFLPFSWEKTEQEQEENTSISKEIYNTIVISSRWFLIWNYCWSINKQKLINNQIIWLYGICIKYLMYMPKFL